MVLTSPKSAHKSMKEQFESVSSYIVDYLWDQPAIYCGTYKKYNEGSLFGAWLDLRTFDSYEEFIDVCKQLHADERIRSLCFRIISASLRSGIQKAVWMKKFSTR